MDQDRDTYVADYAWSDGGQEELRLPDGSRVLQGDLPSLQSRGRGQVRADMPHPQPVRRDQDEEEGVRTSANLPLLVPRLQGDSPGERATYVRLGALAFLLSTFDGLVTLAGWEAGVIEELNPLMKALLEQGPWFFMSVKTIMVAALIPLLVYMSLEVKTARFGLWLCSFVYLLVSIWHLFIIGFM